MTKEEARGELIEARKKLDLVIGNIDLLIRKFVDRQAGIRGTDRVLYGLRYYRDFLDGLLDGREANEWCADLNDRPIWKPHADRTDIFYRVAAGSFKLNGIYETPLLYYDPDEIDHIRGWVEALPSIAGDNLKIMNAMRSMVNEVRPIEFDTKTQANRFASELNREKRRAAGRKVKK